MIIPIVELGEYHDNLVLIERLGDDFSTRDLGAVKFVPMTGDASFHEE